LACPILEGQQACPTMPMDCSTTADRLAAAVSAIRREWSCQAKAAVILGTGLGELADEIECDSMLEYGDIPGFTRSTALAHQGRLVCGHLGGRPVVLLQGRCHLYEGYRPAEVTFPVRVLAALGIQTLIVTNAAGGLNPDFAIGDVMLIEDHIQWTFCGGLARGETFGGRMPRMGTRLYDRELGTVAMAAARRHDFPLQRGVYLSVSGPCYETRAEYRAFRRMGADCVGMSTVPEVLVAAESGLRVVGLSTVTNVACPDAPRKVTAEEVVEVARVARPRVGAIIQAVVAAGC
jgi:purine-nucleoside phosphorylase